MRTIQWNATLLGILGLTAILFCFFGPGIFGQTSWANPDGLASDTNEADPCFAEGPNGIPIANCFANPTDPDPPETPAPTPEVDEDDDGALPPGNNPGIPNVNPADGGTVDIEPSAGGCSLQR